MKKRAGHRADRIGEQIKRELAEIFRLELKDPRVSAVSITEVVVSKDLSFAKIWVTDRTGNAAAAEVLTALQRAAGYLRSELARRFTIYSVPQLTFAYDDSIEKGMQLSALIDEALAQDQQHSLGRREEASGNTE